DDILALGGAIYNEGSLTLVNCALARSHALGDPVFTAGALGGAIYSSGAFLMLRNCSLTANAAVGGSGGGGNYASGGAVFARGPLEMINCTISGNTAYTFGATQGLGSAGGVGSVGGLTLINCTISSNSASGTFRGDSGGLGLNDAATNIVRNSIIAGNFGS